MTQDEALLEIANKIKFQELERIEKDICKLQERWNNIANLNKDKTIDEFFPLRAIDTFRWKAKSGTTLDLCQRAARGLANRLKKKIVFEHCDIKHVVEPPEEAL